MAKESNKREEPEEDVKGEGHDRIPDEDLEEVAGGVLYNNENITAWKLKTTDPRKLD